MNLNLNVTVMDIIAAIVVAILGVIARYIIPWIRAKRDAAEDEVEQIQWDMLIDIIQRAVSSAEQLYTREEGEKKKSYVVGILEHEGYPVGKDAMIDAAIESEVLDLHRRLYNYEE